jgi:hypothetical protein
LLGLLLATIALAIFVLEKSNRGSAFVGEATARQVTRIKRIGRNLRFIRGIRVTCRAVASREGGSAVQQFFKFL